MPKSSALIVGLCHVDPTHYDGEAYSRGVEGAERDVDRVQRMLIEACATFEIETLKTRSATRERVVQHLSRVAGATAPGDLFVMHFSGHGIQRPDEPSGDEETDGLDELLCLFDGVLLDDDLFTLWARFPRGARILFTADCCHSGTIYRQLPPALALRSRARTATAAALEADLIHMSASTDAELAAGYPGGGAFTIAMESAWAGGTFQGDHRGFYRAATDRVTEAQRPEYHTEGPDVASFESARPFTAD